jgi:hypothetical protein
MNTTALSTKLLTLILAFSPLSVIADPLSEAQQESERAEAEQELQELEMIQMLTSPGGSKQPPP